MSDRGISTALDRARDSLKRARAQTRAHATSLAWRLPPRLRAALIGRIELRAMRDHDRTDDALRVPPDGELIQTRIIWIAEIYGPTDIPRLLDGLERLQLARRSGRESIAERLLAGRRGDFLWSHSPLPLLVPRGRSYVPPTARELDLPEGVAAVWSGLTSLPGSITILVAAFVLDTESGAVEDRALRARYSSRLAKHQTGRMVSFEGPEALQREELARARAVRRARLEAWIRENLGGAFASGLTATLPGAELTTFRTDAALERGGWRTWSSALGLWRFERWRSETWEQIVMQHPERAFEDSEVLRLVARESELVPAEDEHGEALDDEGAWWMLVQRLNPSFEGTFALWALARALRAFDGQLAAIRDVGPARSLRARHVVRRVVEANEHFRIAADARAIAADIRGGLDADSFKRWDGGDWALVEPDDERDAELRWIARQAEWLPERAERLLASEAIVRDRIVADAQLAGSVAALRIQRVAVWVAVAAAVLSGAALGVAFGARGGGGGAPRAAPAQAGHAHFAAPVKRGPRP